MQDRAGPSPTAVRISAEARRLLERGGPEGVSIRKVAHAVGLTAMAIYRHYPSREAMLARVVDDVFAELAAAWSAPARGGVRARLVSAFDGSLDYALDHPRLYDYAFASARPGARRFPRDFEARRSPTLNLVADALRQGMREGRFRRGDPWRIALSLWALSHGLVSLFRGGRIDLPRRAFTALHRAALLRHLDGLAR
jgi:AcrR family transcriptional regulator